MAELKCKTPPYGWCLDHSRELSKYETMDWKQYVEMLEKWLNAYGVNYSVIHYKYIVRVHVHFCSIKKLGYRKCVELSMLERSATNWDTLLGPGRMPTDEMICHQVRSYFIKNGLPIDGP